MNKLLFVLLLPHVTALAFIDQIDPHFVLKSMAGFMGEEHIKDLFLKEENALNAGLLDYLIKSHLIKDEMDDLLSVDKNYSISPFSSVSGELDKLKHEYKKLMAQFYREKLDEFANYPMELQSLLLAEAELRLTLTHLNEFGIRRGVVDALRSMNKVQPKKLLKPFTALINCMNNVSENDDKAVNDTLCVSMLVDLTY